MKIIQVAVIPINEPIPAKLTPLIRLQFGNSTRFEYELNRYLWCLTAQSVYYSLFSNFDRAAFISTPPPPPIPPALVFE
jgi:hypothetical protein